MAFNPNFQNNYRNNGGGGGGGGYNGGYNNGGGGGGGGGYGGPHQGGGGYNQGGGGYNQGNGGGYGGGRKRGREDDYGGGDNKRRNNNDYDAPRRDDRAPQQSAHFGQQRFKDAIWGLGSGEIYSPVHDIPRLAEVIEHQFNTDKSLVFEVLRIGITELPHKLPHYAALIAYTARIPQASSTSSSTRLETAPSAAGLPSKPVEATNEVEAEGEEDVEMKTGLERPVEAEVTVNIAHEIVRDLMSALQTYLNERKWRNARYTVLTLSHLAALLNPIISSSSVITLLTTFAEVFDEPGLRASRGDDCVRIIVESLLRMGGTHGEGAEGLRGAVQNYLTTRRIEEEIFGEGEAGSQHEDRIENLVSKLTAEIPTTVSVLPIPYESVIILDNAAPYEGPIALSTITIPHEIEESELVKIVLPAASSAGLRGDEGVGHEGCRLYLQLFNDDSVPAPYDPSGEILKSLIHDIINLYEVNRKECARVLLELPKWIQPGTFKAKAANEDDALVGRDWILENLVVESLLSSLFALPAPALPASYYHGLLCELCRISPTTVAPALGKCVRKLYAGLGEDVDAGFPVLDAEGIRRFSEWFSVHLSNFGFAWGWADWAGHMKLGVQHPKRVFITRTIELEIRLSYFDRVQGTIPSVMLDTGVMEEQAPGPEYDYEDEDNRCEAHPYGEPAAALLTLMRSKGSQEEVEAQLEVFAQGLLEGKYEESVHFETDPESAKRDMAIAVILNVGSRSFSHFLNVLERYLVFIRSISATPEARSEILNTIARFWARNTQFHLIVLNKFLQYRIIDSTDIISYVFSTREPSSSAPLGNKGWSNVHRWTILKSCIETIQGRVKSARVKVDEVLRNQDKPKPSRGGALEVEGENEEVEDAIVDDSEASEILSATSKLEALESELANMVVRIISEFHALLQVPKSSNTKDHFDTWWIEGWFREFCRFMAPSKILTSTAVLKGVEKVFQEGEKNTARDILDSAKAWIDFA